jgi:hypothetical protein
MVIRNGISTYIFLSEKSTVVQTGGIAGVHRTYSIKGRFDLSVDSDAGTASFLRVDANLINSFLQARSLGELFNMTALSGVIIDKSTISFKGKTADGTKSKIFIILTFTDNMVQLKGQTVPPLFSADILIYNMDAVIMSVLNIP